MTSSEAKRVIKRLEQGTPTEADFVRLETALHAYAADRPTIGFASPAELMTVVEAAFSRGWELDQTAVADFQRRLPPLPVNDVADHPGDRGNNGQPGDRGNNGRRK